jgi:predicted outer membrane repeat protein
MKYKKGLLFILILCIFLSISTVSAEDNQTDDISSDAVSDNITQNIETSYDDEPIAQSENEDELSATTIYFDAYASTDGIGTQNRPYNTFKWSRISYGSTVYFKNGVYTIDSTKSISSYTNLRFIGQSRDNTILKSTFDNRSEISINSQNFTFFLNDLTLDGFHISNSGTIDANNVIFQNEIYKYSGASINTDGDSDSPATLKLTNCQFKNNHCTAYKGGAIYAMDSNVIIENCIFYNSSCKSYGGAIYTKNTNLTILNSQFYYSNAGYGGAIYSDKSNIHIKLSQLSSSAALAYGGTIGSKLSEITIEQSNLTDSYSLTDAGGMVYVVDTNLNVYFSTFKNGNALFGGAICNLYSDEIFSDTYFKLTSSHFINNYAEFYGGDIYDGYGNADIYGNVFTNSKAGKSGGSIYSSLTKSLNLTYNSFHNTTADIGPAITIDPILVHADSKFKGSGNKYDGNTFNLKTSPSICFYNTNPYYVIENDNSVPLLDYTPDFVTDLPSSYDSRDYGYMTPVKDQGEGGNCWAFASIATLEACLKKATGITYDFSEENLKNLMARYSLYGVSYDVNDGGTNRMATGYFMSWLGPIYDEIDKYEDLSALSVDYDPVLHIQNIYYVPYNDINFVKKAIVDYGAVSVGMPWTSTGHEITLVGWDDNYNGYDFFKQYTEGAWIFKNSWGENWYDHGYYYVSFNRSITSAYTFIFNDTMGYTDIYQYDLAGPVTTLLVGKNPDYKTRFTSRSNDILSAVSTFFKTETDYTLLIYKNGNLVTTQNGHSLPGYFTIPLNNEIQLKTGDEFEVEFKLTTGSEIGVCYYQTTTWGNHANVISYKQGDSFYKKDNKWNDFYGATGDTVHRTACIKAYTRPASLQHITISMPSQFSEVKLNEEINITVNIPLSYYDSNIVRHALNGFITFTIDNQNYYAEINNGRACLSIKFDKIGRHVFKAQYKTNREISNLISFSFDVLETIQPKISLTAPNVSKYYGGTSKYTATLYKDGSPLKGVYVNIVVDGQEYAVKTNSYGRAILDLDLKLGSYIVKASYDSFSCYSKFTVKSTIAVDNANGTYLNTNMNATFLTSNGYNVQSGQAIFKIGDKEFKADIHDGLAIAKIDLGAGTYNVTVKNPSTLEEMVVKLEISKLKPKISYTYFQQDNVVTVNVTLSAPLNCSGEVWLMGSESTNFYYVNGTTSVKCISSNPRLDTLWIFCYGSENTLYSSLYEDINLKSFEVDLLVNNLTAYYNTTNSRFYAKITNYGQPIVGQQIIFRYPKHYYTRTTDENGEAYITLDAPGEYNITTKYGRLEKTSTIVLKSTISSYNLSYAYQNAKVFAYFKDSNGNYLKNKVVTFTIGPTSYYRSTDNSGYARLDVDRDAGSYDVKICNMNTGEIKTINLQIRKVTPTLTLEMTTRNGKDSLMAKLSTINATGKITFKCDGKDYTASAVGGTSYLIFSNPGTFNVNVVYSGDTNYNQVSKSIKVFIPDKDPTLIYSNLNMAYLDNKKFTVRLVDYLGNPLSSKKIQFQIYDDDYFAVSTFYKTTDSKGYASFTFNKKPGTYQVEMTFGDTYLGDAKIFVKKAKSMIKASKKTFKAKTKTKKIKASLELRDYYLIGYTLTLKIKGKTYKAITKSKGKATFKIKNLNKKGTYRGVISFKGDSKHTKASKKIKIKVK